MQCKKKKEKNLLFSTLTTLMLYKTFYISEEKKNTLGRVIVAMFIPVITLTGLCVCMWHTQTHRGLQAQQSITPLCFLSQNLSNDQSDVMIQSTQQGLSGVTITHTFLQGVQAMRTDCVLFEHPCPQLSHTRTRHLNRVASSGRKWEMVGSFLAHCFLNLCRWPTITGFLR